MDDVFSLALAGVMEHNLFSLCELGCIDTLLDKAAYKVLDYRINKQVGIDV